ncbi:CobW family GTP-binding protein [Amphritea pacifica]|uniref:GTP-binding protein n=1 Tax=Amphritea pacifica TaxID=2811233 RepID=A0ABS2W5F5_9GAMM|nr:GTP-binding protein [Amphritea pacifica]MBN0986939.1 GTP-binding protein [Amphritea pacifica]MBN1006343.1 GTP-binding protein [Amphritea pacifica]
MFRQIPTNIITGFLGVGKTTAIQYLLTHKPADERWAVLVNEFGEVGIDASLLGNEQQATGVFMREVPGGCMCCAAGIPMQVALSQLIRQAKPDRILIEPTGLGHPLEVIRVLQQPHYQDVLDLRSTITLVDARKLSDPRYTDNDTFNQQLQVADRVVAHKADLYRGNETEQLVEYLQTLVCNPPVVSCSDGQLSLTWLDKDSKHNSITGAESHQHSDHQHDHFQADDELPECGYLRKDNQSEGYYSSGWIFSPEFEFDYSELEPLLMGIEAERLKAVFITSEGIFAFNMADSVLKVQALDEVMDSRIEVIGQQPVDAAALERQLLAMAVRY